MTLEVKQSMSPGTLAMQLSIHFVGLPLPWHALCRFLLALYLSALLLLYVLHMRVQVRGARGWMPSTC
jgi:hypothetical protein